MPDYKNGKIYKLWSLEGDKIYIGSTIQPLYKRLNGHKCKRDCKSKLLFEIYKDVKIELLEEFSCENKQQLIRREGEIMRENKEFIVNGRIAGRTTKEYREDNKEQHKKWCEDNKEQLKEYNKQYNEENKEHLKLIKREWQVNNKDKIEAHRKERRERIKLNNNNNNI